MSYIQNIALPTSNNTKFITGYSFNTSTASVRIDERFDTILYIANLTTDDVIYNPLHKGRGGSVEGNIIFLDYPMTGLNDSDKLLIAVQGLEVSTLESDTEAIKKEMKYLNKQISKIRQ